MTNRRVSTVTQAGLSAVAALALIVPSLALTALGQTAGGKGSEEAAKPRSQYLNDGVYKISVVAYVFDSSNFARRASYHSVTGVLIREPNLILTTTVYDSENKNIFDNPATSALAVCQQELDPVRVAAEKKKIETDKTTIEEHLHRFEGLKPQDKKKAEERIKDSSPFLAQQANCVPATVKKIDVGRYGLVLIEAREKLTGSVPAFNVSDPETGTTVRVFGFPEAADFSTRRSTEAERTRNRLIPTITTGTVVKTTTDTKDGQVIMHQAPVSSGSWGSPLVNNCDEVVGLNYGQKSQAVVRVDGQSRRTGDRSGEVQVDKTYVPTSNVVAAAGAKELVTFASLNGIDLPNVNKSACTALLTTTSSLQQNMWTILVGGSALLLAATALVVAMRRPGPVRNTMVKMFPAMGRTRQTATLQRGYGDPYNGGGRPTPDYMPESTTAAAAYAPRPRPADPTNLMPAGQYASHASAAAMLVPIGGGQPVALDGGRLDAAGLTFGRESSCDIVSDNSTVSKRHARITRTSNGKLQIEDLGSANGTWRGRSRIQRETFSAGDVVRFGSLEYRIELSGNGSGPTMLMPSASWLLAGSDEKGNAVQWHLQPTTDASGRQVEASWIVGRTSDRADKVLSDKRVSAAHAKIRYTPQRGLEICDLGSSNGTKVDGRKITDSFVAIDDARVIEFGGCAMSISKQ
jgi:pSer/pThr/pTyr-binding forkhead associated (FHA) protein